MNKAEEVPVPKCKVPVVIDTLKIKRVDRTEYWFTEAVYEPFYIGIYMDSIFVIYSTSSLTSNVGNNYDERLINYKKPDSDDLQIFVDTTRTISDYSAIWLTDSLNTIITMSNEAYPIFIYNKSKDTLNIGHRFRLPLILEAKDKDGQWKPIEADHLPQYQYEPNFNALFFPPNQIVISTVPLNKGSFHTKLRLVYNHILSNEFYGNIHLTQFESEFDENGERKSKPKH